MDHKKKSVLGVTNTTATTTKSRAAAIKPLTKPAALPTSTSAQKCIVSTRVYPHKTHLVDNMKKSVASFVNVTHTYSRTQGSQKRGCASLSGNLFTETRAQVNASVTMNLAGINDAVALSPFSEPQKGTPVNVFHDKVVPVPASVVASGTRVSRENVGAATTTTGGNQPNLPPPVLTNSGGVSEGGGADCIGFSSSSQTEPIPTRSSREFLGKQNQEDALDEFTMDDDNEPSFPLSAFFSVGHTAPKRYFKNATHAQATQASSNLLVERLEPSVPLNPKSSDKRLDVAAPTPNALTTPGGNLLLAYQRGAPPLVQSSTHASTTQAQSRGSGQRSTVKAATTGFAASSRNYSFMFGTPTVYNGIRFRSILESKFAKLMDALKVRYVYEPIKYNLAEGGTYCIDFFLPDQQLYIELKPKRPHIEEEYKCEEMSTRGFRVVLMYGEVKKPPFRSYSTAVTKTGKPFRDYTHNDALRGITWINGVKLPGDAVFVMGKHPSFTTPLDITETDKVHVNHLSGALDGRWNHPFILDAFHTLL